MSNSINSVNILGYLGGNPNVGVSQGGVASAQLSLGCNQSWKDRGGNPQKRTDWIRVVAFNGLATSLARLQKGDQVAVSGRLQSKIYKDKEGVNGALPGPPVGVRGSGRRFPRRLRGGQGRRRRRARHALPRGRLSVQVGS